MVMIISCQGFKVYLYDNPDPKSGYRPGQTPVERIQGEVTVFLGIPYALPPIQEGRFKPPRIHRGWQLLQAVEFGPACPQHVRYTGATKGIRDMDEDCLYLNVYSPSYSIEITSGARPLSPTTHPHDDELPTPSNEFTFSLQVNADTLDLFRILPLHHILNSLTP
uniref:Carboxylesterase type B domain-containing protein n=1 Tax=Timema tahoe TaxID=61484 RepID=A0A7R9FJN9_9NEOP|nr:unnamed protein product [Timema tahoe]